MSIHAHQFREVDYHSFDDDDADAPMLFVKVEDNHINGWLNKRHKPAD